MTTHPVLRALSGSRARLHSFRMLIIALMLSPTAGFAQAAGKPAVDTGDTAWLLTSAALVLLMTPGLALFYGGMVRAKNVLSTLMHSFAAMALISVLWAVCGYSIAFAPGNAFFGGLEFFGLNGVGADPNPTYCETVPHSVFMVYQMMFAIITPALISGALADRIRFSAYYVFIGLWSLLIYAPLAHMVWGDGGLLRNLGALDFAGGTVVHISSGVSALVLALMLGKRAHASAEDMRPHNLPMTLMGTGVLWFGWFGFNAGSALGAGGLAASAFVATHLAAAAAGLSWVTIEWIIYRKPTALGLATGAVAGLVAVTPAAGFVGPMAALAVGALASVASFFAIRAKNRFGYDDALDVFGVHGVAGTWGAIATGLFASLAINPDGGSGLFLGGGASLLAKQVIGVAVAVAVAAVGTAIIGGVVKAAVGLRVSADEEEVGLDLSQHGEAGYAGPSTGSENGLQGLAVSLSTPSVTE